MATGIVLAGIALLAVPLHRLTSSPVPASAAPSALPAAAGTESATPAVLRVRLLAPARSLRLSGADGRVLWDAANLPAGESEYDATLGAFSGTLDLQAQADFGNLSGDTALFLTVMPDGREERQAHAIGGPIVSAALHFEWPH
jgi:hypothetical protein